MIGSRSLALLCLVGGALAAPALRDDIQCPDQNENSTLVTVANPDNCSTFYECDNGVAKLFACPATLYFSSKDGVCTYKKDSDCPDAEAFLSATLDDGDGVNFTCPDEPDNTTSTYYPNAKNCSNFYECSNEIPILLDCPKRLYFNAKLCVCTLPKKSGCTQPDDGDDGGDSGFFALLDDVSDMMTDDEELEMRAHHEKVYSGKCKKKEL